jgi:hypothetical protein
VKRGDASGSEKTVGAGECKQRNIAVSVVQMLYRMATGIKITKTAATSPPKTRGNRIDGTAISPAANETNDAPRHQTDNEIQERRSSTTDNGMRSVIESATHPRPVIQNRQLATV